MHVAPPKTARKYRSAGGNDDSDHGLDTVVRTRESFVALVQHHAARNHITAEQLCDELERRANTERWAAITLRHILDSARALFESGLAIPVVAPANDTLAAERAALVATGPAKRRRATRGDDRGPCSRDPERAQPDRLAGEGVRLCGGYRKGTLAADATGRDRSTGQA